MLRGGIIGNHDEQVKNKNAGGSPLKSGAGQLDGPTIAADVIHDLTYANWRLMLNKRHRPAKSAQRETLYRLLWRLQGV
jgi:hypothetical protein